MLRSSAISAVRGWLVAAGIALAAGGCGPTAPSEGPPLVAPADTVVSPAKPVAPQPAAPLTAEAPTPAYAAPAAADHWAWKPPARHPLPPLSPTHAHWPRRPLDRFILARLKTEGLAPSPEAERAGLLRRLSLDLTGLPPSLADVLAFERDPSPDAYEQQIERLLASPAFGEHWTRHWLDLARYADTNGYSNDHFRPIWRWRDWVIRAINSDMPFDQFTIQQIAGDLLPEPTLAQRIATGFSRNTMFNGEGGADPEEFRVEAVVDRVETTAAIWLGLSIGCARCHDHPHDAVTQREFYQLFAIYNQTTDIGAGLNVDPDPLLNLGSQEQENELDAVRSAMTERKLALALEGQGKDLKEDAEYQRLVKREGELLKSIPRTLVMVERAEPRTTRVLSRGDWLQPRELVVPGVPRIFPPLAAASTRPTRLDLARWLVDRQNPVAARLMVNRVWEKLFGTGLVATPDDFGVHGEPPSHPELLDTLAVELMDSDWQLKGLVREIVLSATYRQSSALSPALLAHDPKNRLLARGPRHRLDAEAIRDVAQSASGLLDRRVGGPPAFPPQPADFYKDYDVYYREDTAWPEITGPERHRRGMYTFWRRSALYPSFFTFDAPDRTSCVATRPRTNTPLQALVTLNDPAFVEAAVALARRMLRECDGDARARAEYGFRLCVSRKPTEAELDLLVTLAGERDSDIVRESGAVGEFSPQSAEEGSWTNVAAVLLNLDATISKW